MDTPGVILYTLYRCWGCFVKGFFDLQSAEFPGTCPALCICSFTVAGIVSGLVPYPCMCTVTVRLLLVFSFVYPGF